MSSAITFPSNPSIKKLVNKTVKAGEQNEKNFSEDMVGSDLDVPVQKLMTTIKMLATKM